MKYIGCEVYVATMTIFISNSYGNFEDTINHLKSIKLKRHLGENVKNWCAAILIDTERLKSGRVFNPDHLGYIIHIFEDTSGYRLHIW